jgi:pimeloyl-ACP methyl ester carboxylesterase
MSAIKESTVEANGIHFATLEVGSGPLVLCLHGFPDTAHTFRDQLPVLAGAGYRAVAPFMRGYAPTSPAKDARYQSAVLGLDAVALIEALGEDSAHVFGHDWGALAAYGAAIIAPHRVRKLITAAVPHGPGVLNAFFTNFDQQKRSWYMFFFQHPFSDAAVGYDDYRFLERLWRDWSPNWNYSEADLEALKRTFRQPGVLDAALGYYRCTLNPALQDPDLAEIQGSIASAPVEVPSVILFGQADGCMSADLTEGMEALFPRGLRKVVLPGAGHFVHRERPDEVNRILLETLAEVR